MESLGYLGLFISSFISATVIPFSSEAVLGILFAQGYNVSALLLVATIGNTFGGMTGYWLGRWDKWTLLLKYFGIKQNQLEKYYSWITRFDALIAFLCWLPVIGDILAVALGVAKSDVKKVFLYMFIGKLLRYIGILIILKYSLNLPLVF